MNNNFVTKDDLQLMINGNAFELDTTDLELLQRLDDYAKSAPKKGAELSKRTDYIEAVREAMDFALEGIDSLLGVGASNRIFKDEKVTLMKALNVIDYITTRVNESRNQSLNKYQPNREERRSKPKVVKPKVVKPEEDKE